MLYHHWRYRRDLDHLIVQRRWVITSSTRSIGNSSEPDPGWPAWPLRLRSLPLRRSGRLKSGPSPEGGLEELRELRTILSRRLAMTTRPGWEYQQQERPSQAVFA